MQNYAERGGISKGRGVIKLTQSDRFGCNNKLGLLAAAVRLGGEYFPYIPGLSVSVFFGLGVEDFAFSSCD